MSDFKFKTDDGEFTFSAEQLVEKPDGFLSTDELGEKYLEKDFVQNSLIPERIGKAKRNALQDVENDEEFFKRLATKRGVKFDENGKPQTGSDVNIDELRATWEQEHLQPLKDQIRLRDEREKDNEAFKALSKVFQDNAVELLIPQATKGLQRDKFGNWSKVDASGEFLIASNATSERPYMGLEEMVKELAEKHSYLLKDQTQSGAGVRGGSTKPFSSSKKASEMSVSEKSAFIAEHGLDKWNEILKQK